MRGGSLTRFRPDDTQLGEGIIGNIVKATLLGGLTGLKSSQRLGDVQKNTVQGLKQLLKRGVKRKAKEILTKEVAKRTKTFRDIFGV